MPQHAPESRQPLTLPRIRPRIVVWKSKRQLLLYANDRIVRTYRIGLGFRPVGDKKRQGDGATPEGTFYIFTKNPRSAYYLSLGISYPGVDDAQRGLRDKLIGTKEYSAILRAQRRKTAPPQRTALGGDIFIHGNGSKRDWTLGCIALDNPDMKELFHAIPTGTPVEIHP
ncbi:MAG: L,D-transpeptidase family protein [Armatimonadaceae bacterium]